MKRKANTDKLNCLQSESLNQPGTQQPFPIELNATDWLGLAKKLAEAIGAKTDSHELSACERERFERNFELVRRVKTAEEVRNYALLEIHEAKQWRANYRNVVELAKAFEISKSQFYKAIKSAEINIQMAQAGLYHLKPKGRHVELLGKIDKEHRVEAWRSALAAASEKGGGSKVIERALDDFVEGLTAKAKAGIAIGEAPMSVLQLEIDAQSIYERNDDEVAGWITDLKEVEEAAFECLISLDTWYATLKDPWMSTGCSVAHELVSAAMTFVEANDKVESMRDAMRLAVRKDPRLKRGFYHLGLYLVARHINERYRQKHPR